MWVGSLVFIVFLIAQQSNAEERKQALGASSQFPNRDITMIVNKTPGGGYDLIARAIAPYIEKYLPKKVNIVVQNMGGARGKQAFTELVKATPDGHTFGLMDIISYAGDQVIGTISIDLHKMTWLARIDTQTPILPVSPSTNFKSLKDLQNAKRQLRYATTGEWIIPAMIAAQELKIDVRPILYGGSKEDALATLRGDADYTIFSAASLKNIGSAGDKKLIPVVTLSEERAPEYPDIPNLKEEGYPEVAKMMGSVLCRVFIAPPGLPKDIANELEQAIAKAIRDPEYNKMIEKAGYVMNYGDPKVVVQRLDGVLASYEKYKDIINQHLAR